MAFALMPLGRRRNSRARPGGVSMRNRGRWAILAVFGLMTAAATGLAPREGAEALIGTWTWSWRDADGVMHKHVLEVEGAAGKVAARERFDEEAPIAVTDLKLTGKRVTFSVRRDERRSEYNGELKTKDRIEGRVNVSTEGQPTEYGWEATREPAKK
jgi:hypothetical protein